MFFKDILREDATESPEEKAEDIILGIDTDDTDSDEFTDKIANLVNAAVTNNTLEAMVSLIGGQEAVDEYFSMLDAGDIESVSEAIISSAAKNNNVMHLNARSDMKRRMVIASILIARSKNDPLFKKYATFKKKFKQLRTQIYKKYAKVAFKAAKKSVDTFNKTAKNLPQVKFVKDRTGNRTSFSAVTNG